MSNITVLVGPTAKGRSIEALPFLPGLYVHATVSTKESGLYSISHVLSGLVVISYVLEVELELVRMIFGRIHWDIDAIKIYNDNRYYKLLLEALSVTRHTISQKQEKRVAADLSGKVQPASGSRWGCKRDVLTPGLLIEAKTTQKNSYSISLKDFNYLTNQAYAEGRVPVYIVDLARKESIAVLPVNDLNPILLEDKERKEVKARKKSFSVKVDYLSWLNKGNYYVVPTTDVHYLIISYRTFLDFAKSGI